MDVGFGYISQRGFGESVDCGVFGFSRTDWESDTPSFSGGCLKNVKMSFVTFLDNLTPFIHINKTRGFYGSCIYSRLEGHGEGPCDQE